MEEINMMRSRDNIIMGQEQEEDDEQVLHLPGYRFHPTDEELVGFYLSKKIHLKKPSKIDEIITQIDIYKFDPWNLPKSRNTEKESYFFCKRGRKYRNSIRPNRVTGSGFWKATGIDKHVYSSDHNGPNKGVIGLKKTLVYYLGSAGKGSKTDWMMHEFRLPSDNDTIPGGSTRINPTPPSMLHAEVWTLCRIFKRNVSSRKYTPEWRELASEKRVKSQESYKYQEAYISFGDNESSSSTTNNMNVMESKGINDHESNVFKIQETQHYQQYQQVIPMDSSTTKADSVQCFANDNIHNINYESWDELRSVVEFAFAPSNLS
ncbi:unnamed protein product [Cochlearia groenlandica]